LRCFIVFLLTPVPSGPRVDSVDQAVLDRIERDTLAISIESVKNLKPLPKVPSDRLGWPDLEVYVHERGAPHLVDPSKLLASAERLYGDKLGYLWGEILPVPEANVRPLTGGETVLGMRVAYTPGHASHHVCYFHEQSGTAFCGDVAAWSPERLALTHFGAIEQDVPGHVEKVKAKLRKEADLARQMPEQEYNADLEARIFFTSCQAALFKNLAASEEAAFVCHRTRFVGSYVWPAT
jgi:hypothetical protein